MKAYKINYGYSPVQNDFSQVTKLGSYYLPVLEESDWDKLSDIITDAAYQYIILHYRGTQTIQPLFNSVKSTGVFNKVPIPFFIPDADYTKSIEYFEKNLSKLFTPKYIAVDTSHPYIYLWTDKGDYYTYLSNVNPSYNNYYYKTTNTRKDNILGTLLIGTMRRAQDYFPTIPFSYYNNGVKLIDLGGTNYQYSDGGVTLRRGNLSTNYMNAFKDFMGNEKPINPKDLNDPYFQGGTSTGNGVGGGGGTGDFDNTSDTISIPHVPSLSGLNTGFFTAFIPSASQMQSVSNYLWNNFLEDLIDPDSTIGEKVDALKKIVANPYDAIMGCSVIPVTPPTAGSKELKMYGLIDTGISIPYASTRWVTVDCGTLNIHEFWGGYLDYSPYTKTTSLYLPYIGTVSIDIDLIMAKALQVVYRVDILSGICVAFILVDGSVKFHYQGQCATQIPITNADYSSVISAGIGLIGSASQVVGSAVAGGTSGGPIGAVLGAVGGAVAQAPSIAGNVMGMKPDIRSGGSVGSSAGILSVQRPYLIIERPRQSAPAQQNAFTGYPSNITASVGELKGYTEFETINLDNLFLTDAEKEELSNIMKGGVYL